VTFAMFVAQVGMARRSAAVSRGVGRLAIGATVCALIEIGIGGLYAIANVAFSPNPYHHRYGYSSYPNHDEFYMFTVLGLFPLTLIVLLILYHRLLAAARRSIQGEEG
jgi:hypothetical protein